MERNKLNKSHKNADGQIYRKMKGVAQKTIKAAAQESWQKYCNSIDKNTKLGSVWRQSKKMSGVSNKRSIQNLIQNSMKFETNLDKANLFAETFSEISSDKNYSNAFIEHKKTYQISNKHEFTDVSFESERKTPLNEKFRMKELK